MTKHVHFLFHLQTQFVFSTDIDLVVKAFAAGQAKQFDLKLLLLSTVSRIKVFPCAPYFLVAQAYISTIGLIVPFPDLPHHLDPK